MLNKHFSLQRVGIVSLLFPLLLLPMLHYHPAYEHVHGEARGHQHQPVAHADFFPEATHGHDHHDNPAQHVQDFEVTTDASHHAFFQIDLLSLHIGEFYWFFSVFKRNPVALDRDSLDLFPSRHVQRAAPPGQNTPVLQRFYSSSASLRAPPYST